jgi:hypothetical protein
MSPPPSLHCSVRARIVSPGRNSFRFAEDGEQHPDLKEVDVAMELREADGGCYLLLTPAGCLPFDYYYQSLEAAIVEAERYFGEPRAAWKPRR